MTIEKGTRKSIFVFSDANISTNQENVDIPATLTKAGTQIYVLAPITNKMATSLGKISIIRTLSVVLLFRKIITVKTFPC